MAVTDSRATSIGYFTGVFPSSLFSVTVENLQDTGVICGLDIVLIGSPDWLAIFCPAHVHILAACVRDLKLQRLADPQGHVFQLFHKLHRF